MNKEEQFELFLESKGICPVNCHLCYFNIGTIRYKNNRMYHCYAFRFDYHNPTSFIYKFIKHYMNRKVKKMKEILS
jgi:hypothetical protein